MDTFTILDEDIFKFLIAEVILGMKYIHEKGVIFRDLKPENILLDSRGHIRLADFGLATKNDKAEGAKDLVPWPKNKAWWRKARKHWIYNIASCPFMSSSLRLRPWLRSATKDIPRY